MNLDRQISKLIAACAEYHHQNAESPMPNRKGVVYRQLADAVSKAFLSLSEFHTAVFAGWESDPDNPGYLAHMNPPAAVRVPFYLMPLFPDDQSIDEFWLLSRKIKSTPHSILCLSGSNAVGRAFKYVNDIDFCEYVPVNHKDLFGFIVDKVLCGGEVIRLKLKIFDNNWTFPSQDHEADVLDVVQNVDVTNSERSSLKIDYLVPVFNGRAREASNILIFCDLNWNSAAKIKTFAGQEIIMATSDWVPNQLNDIDQLGRYVLFLFGEAKKYKEAKNHLKACKRALSLCRLCGYTDLSSEITSLFERSSAIIKAEIAEVNRIWHLIKGLPKHEQDQERIRQAEDKLVKYREDLIAEVDSTSKEPSYRNDEEFVSDADEILKRMLKRFEADAPGVM
jgi:hypothetical protein